MLKAQRWLLRDLLALYEHGAEAIRSEYELSLSYRVGVKMLPWSRVNSEAVLIRSRNDSEENLRVAAGNSAIYSPDEAVVNLEAVLKGDPLDFIDALHLVGEHLLDEAGSSQKGVQSVLMGNIIKKICFNSNSHLLELVEMQRVWNETEKGMADLRSAYERSTAYRFGCFLGRVRGITKASN